MKDPEFIELKNRFFLGSLICIVFFGLVFFILWMRLTNRDPEIIRKMKQKEDIIILVTEEDCETCNITENALIQEELIYETISKEEKNYKKIVRKLKLEEEKIVSPTVIYVKKGVTKVAITNVQTEEEVTEFVEKYKLKKEAVKE